MIPFVERHDLWSAAQNAAVDEVVRAIEHERLELVRFAFADQHGIVRGKTLVASEAVRAMRAGVGMVGTVLLKDTSHRTVWPVFEAAAGFATPEFEGAADVVLVADPLSFKRLPWAPGTGWLLCNAHFADGRPVPYDTRWQCARALRALAEAGYDYVAGLEVECYLFRLEDPRLAPQDAGWPGEPPQVSLLEAGYQLLTEQRYDQLEPALEIVRRNAQGLGLALRSMEVELGPSQVEFVFEPMRGMEAADAMILFRSAAKQSLRRAGYHASFMCRPRIPNVMSSGWHLHQSLVGRADRGASAAAQRPGAVGTNALMPDRAGGDPLSPLGMRFLAGLLAHARGAAAFAAPTINAYRRYRANSLAPDRAVWGRDNRGAMLRVVGGPSDPATRIENRAGEPAANPYLYIASQVHAGLDGVVRELDPGPSADAPYRTQAQMLPRSLAEALDALADDTAMRAGFGADFVDYFLRIKRAEIARFEQEVTDWEHREYLDLF